MLRSEVDHFTIQLLLSLANGAGRDWAVMGNNADVYDPANDGKRLQSYVSFGAVLASGLDVESILRRHDLWCASHEIDRETASFLLSECFALDQRLHADMNFRATKFLSSDSVPLSVIVALDDSHLRVCDGCIKGRMLDMVQPQTSYVPLSRGDVVVFRCDLVHSGAYNGATASKRLHMVAHMPSEGLTFDTRVTHLPPFVSN